MRTSVRWSEKAQEIEGFRPSVLDLVYSPNGEQLVAAIGARLIMYNSTNGSIINTMKGHRDTIYCVTYAHDGKRFASGGADKTVIIWTNKGEGFLKYQHNDSIQALAANPVSAQIVSVTATDFGLWQADQKSVSKHKLPFKGLCCSWTIDGQSLAIGMFNGHITIRSKTMEEKVLIKRNAPVWTLSFNPVKEEGTDILAVGSWDQRLSFYTLNGKQIGKDKELAFDPCCVSFFSTGDYLLVAGSDHKTGLYTKDGTFLVQVAEASDWIWAVRQRPKQMTITCGTNDGNMSSIDLNITTVHSIYQDMYVYRENMTDVVVQQLTTDRKLKFSCRDYIKKVAIYKERLAIQLSDRIVVYEIFFDDQFELRHKEKEKIRKKLECSLLCVTASNLILCQDKRLTSYDFHGNKRREWSMESVIRYIKVVGGLADREALLVGLKDGQILKIFIDNAFPSLLLKLTVPVRCLDLSASRAKLAVVDENNLLQVFYLANRNELVFQEANIMAVAWNSDYEDMMCYTGNNLLSIKTGALPAYQQRMQGLVVGFKANKVFTLHMSVMTTVDVPHSHALYRYVERREFDAAYRVACLGVTEGDWKMLGTHAMTHLQLEIARKAFIRIREVKFVELLNRIELERRQMSGTASDEGLLLGDILAFQSKYHDAARYFVRANQEAKAIEMFCDMKMWAEAKQVCTNEDHLKDLIRRQARSAEDAGDYSEAASFYLAAGDFQRAVRMMGECRAVEKLIEVCRTLPKSDVALITECGVYFRKEGAHSYAIEAFEKIADAKSLLQLHVEMGLWKEAFKLLDRYPQYAGEVYVPWAGWLAVNDRFEEAQEAFKLAKRPREALRMMEQLSANSVVCRKFADAAFYFLKLAEECGVLAEGERQPTREEYGRRIAKHNAFVRKADMYYAYDAVYRYVTQPMPMDPLSIFNAAKYLLAMMSDSEEIPHNIAKVDVLFSLARLATMLEMNRMARNIYERLQQVVLPVQVMEQLDMETLLIRGRPYHDKEENCDVCFRCGNMVPTFTVGGDRCPMCGHSFMRSFKNFNPLPLVEFVLSNDISDADAVHIIETGVGKKPKAPTAGQPAKAPGTDVMTFNVDDGVDALMEAELNADGTAGWSGGKDPFYAQLAHVMRPGRPKGEYQPFVCNAEMLRQFRRGEVFVVKRGYGHLSIKYRYYRSVVQGVGITLCECCQHFFHDEEYELVCMRGNGCPLCRFKPGKKERSELQEMMMAGIPSGSTALHAM